MVADGADAVAVADWEAASAAMSWAEAAAAAASPRFGGVVDVSRVAWCSEKPRTREGFYLMQPGIPNCIARAKKYAPYADLIWMETATPCLDDARPRPSPCR